MIIKWLTGLSWIVGVWGVIALGNYLLKARKLEDPKKIEDLATACTQNAFFFVPAWAWLLARYVL